jgi:hypothetical protein
MMPSAVDNLRARTAGSSVSMMGMTTAVHGDRDRRLLAVRLAGAALARKAAS